MKRVIFAAIAICTFTGSQAAQAQIQYGYIPPNQPQARFGVPGYNPYGYPGVSPYISPYVSPYSYGLPNTLNYGTYNLTPGLGVSLPSFGLPQALGGSYFGINTGGTSFRVWQAPSGYYYPWCGAYSLGYQAPIIYVAPGSSSPTPAQPPLSTIFSDLDKFLEESRQKDKLNIIDYNHLKLRARDLQSKERSLRIGGGGSLDPGVEADLRKDIDQLSQEVARRVRQ